MVESISYNKTINLLKENSKKKPGKPMVARLIFVSVGLLRFALCPGDDILAVTSIAPITGSGIESDHQAVLPNKIEIVDERALSKVKNKKIL